MGKVPVVKGRQTEYASKGIHNRHSNSDRAPPDNKHEQTCCVEQEKRSHAEPLNFAGKRHGVTPKDGQTKVRPHWPQLLIALEEKADLTRGEGGECSLVYTIRFGGSGTKELVDRT